MTHQIMRRQADRCSSAISTYHQRHLIVDFTTTFPDLRASAANQLQG